MKKEITNEQEIEYMISDPDYFKREIVIGIVPASWIYELGLQETQRHSVDSRPCGDWCHGKLLKEWREEIKQ